MRRMEVGGWRFVHIVPLIEEVRYILCSLILATINKQPNKTNEKTLLYLRHFLVLKLTLHFLVLKLTLEVRVKFTLYECYIQYIILYLRHFLVLKLTLEVRVQFILNECYIQYIILFASFSSFEIDARN